jgi:eukaryotic-like serine/threonine-protein kinase
LSASGPHHQENDNVNPSHATQRPDQDGPSPARSSTSLGKYRLIARLGTGGMAEVFLAVAQGAMNVNRLVVVKRLRDQQADDESSRTMFLNEARLAARLAHPNVIQTFEAGTEGGSYFLAMEYVDGQPLSRVLTALKRAHRRMDPKLAARICADALQGLHYAHDLTDFDGSALQIVHRDVSPQNIMLTYDGVVKIVDFGIAKAAGTSQTEHGVFKGKVAFMAPEQLLGGAVDRRVDVFAAGIVLWEAVTGQHLMAADTPAKTLYNLMNKVIPRASEICPDVPSALDDILARALERDADRRYASAREMRDALEGFIASSGGITAEAIGTLVTSFFADTRAKVQREVKTQLAVLSLGRQSDPALQLNPHLSGTHIRSDGSTLVDLSDSTAIRTASMSGGGFRVVTATGVTGVAPVSRTRRIAMVVWIAVTLGAVGVSGLALSRSQQSPPPAPLVATAAVVAPVAPPVPVVATPAPMPAPTAEHASAPATGTPAPHPVAVPVVNTPPAQQWRPVVASRPAPAPAPPPAAASAPPEAPRPAASLSAPAPTTKPADTGRTFRRDL